MICDVDTCSQLAEYLARDGAGVVRAVCESHLKHLSWSGSAHPLTGRLKSGSVMCQVDMCDREAEFLVAHQDMRMRAVCLPHLKALGF